jgi:hypothetical protein
MAILYDRSLRSDGSVELRHYTREDLIEVYDLKLTLAGIQFGEGQYIVQPDTPILLVPLVTKPMYSSSVWSSG